MIFPTRSHSFKTYQNLFKKYLEGRAEGNAIFIAFRANVIFLA